ncbi:MAG: hypothetical protein MUF65_06015 [Rubritepida sp.]|jgi:hypothetical protein|nr:hypothetical protein [Rubritepida sp.]MCU0944910.1 hypothetical protein [Rubritepida sp.]
MFRRPILAILMLVVLLLGLGALWLAAFPPAVTPVPVERVLPNDRFQVR